VASTIQSKRKIVSAAPPTLDYETGLWQAGYLRVAGLDEAGRGAWAGPVAAAVVILPPENADIAKVLKGVRDSKQMTALQRERWAGVIRRETLWGVGLAECGEIDRIGILRATRLAMSRALETLPVAPDYLLLDAVLLRDIDTDQTALIRGDGLSLSIAAASVLAKTARDRILSGMEETYPGYGFCRHKGYGTRAHQSALEEKGACAGHRRSFEPIRQILSR
jgi:ribonuclease HII